MKIMVSVRGVPEFLEGEGWQTQADGSLWIYGKGSRLAIDAGTPPPVIAAFKEWTFVKDVVERVPVIDAMIAEVKRASSDP